MLAMPEMMPLPNTVGDPILNAILAQEVSVGSIQLATALPKGEATG